MSRCLELMVCAMQRCSHAQVLLVSNISVGICLLLQGTIKFANLCVIDFMIKASLFNRSKGLQNDVTIFLGSFSRSMVLMYVTKAQSLKLENIRIVMPAGRN
jgi:hypothetical protein